jgi:hypothetical protein
LGNNHRPVSRKGSAGIPGIQPARTLSVGFSPLFKCCLVLTIRRFQRQPRSLLSSLSRLIAVASLSQLCRCSILKTLQTTSWACRKI